ncbi:TPA: Fic family protein [Candidatus Woesearchaeota archaeon]|nr:Fic family protein [Candidatus Woesearchaeota archaeon]
MVYIYKKIIADKAYYYLRASQKKGSKTIVKDIAYLGSKIKDVKDALEKLPKYKEQIRKAYTLMNIALESNLYLEKIHASKIKKNDYLDYGLLTEIEACKLHYNTVFKKMHELTKQEIFKNFIIEFAYNTASIEGNTIKLIEARNLLQEGFTPKNKTLREIYDLQNTETIFNSLFTSKEDINHELIIDIHTGLLKNIDSRIGYRTEDVRVFKSRFDSSPAQYVKTDMGLLLKWYNENKNNLHPLVLAAVFHHKFEKIHPFMDGNGRTGRMLLNYILLRNDYPPLIIHAKKRKEYLDALDEADDSKPTSFNKKEYTQLLGFAADEMIASYWGIFL